MWTSVGQTSARRLRKPMLALSLCAAALGAIAGPAQAQKREKQLSGAFRTAFQFSGLGKEWWLAEYDHPAKWFRTSWRKDAAHAGPAGLSITLQTVPEDRRVSAGEMAADDGTLHSAGKTAKDFVSAQLQRRKWFGYGRYEVVMRPASGAGVISAFYLYTGAHFGDSHEEIDIKFLGKDTTRVEFNRFRDGEPLAEPPSVDLGYDAAQEPTLYAIEWTEESISWFYGETEAFRIRDASMVPRPPMKIYIDLWAGSARQADWLGMVAADVEAETLVQCVSFVPAGKSGMPQCSDLMQAQ
ncbi:family 16 glycosylhydrolase [Salipiger sp. CCB-MM3]|uniref:family 16 glycosylhydrolase n=1 Tax=Salipiger sp. CCB-MM3 TaxID=1792508 RepID=UPI00187DD5A1|nr:family 16 glycosylhydrolase [Salipiger sp. CCB-MM3]